MASKTKIVYQGTGRRKKSIARVRLTSGTGKIVINDEPIEEYFESEILKVIVNQPFAVTNTVGKYDVVVKRALNSANAEFRPQLKSNGFLTRDPRMKERKKYGLKKARKAPQFSKR